MSKQQRSNATQRSIGRRKFMVKTSAVLAGSGLATLGFPAIVSGAKGEITLYAWYQVVFRKLIPQFEEETGIDGKRILKWANMADLMRISGVGEEYSELLEAAGVDTVKELKHRNAANLAEKMSEVNEDKKLVRQVPSESQVTKWVEQAKELPPMMTY